MVDNYSGTVTEKRKVDHAQRSAHLWPILVKTANDQGSLSYKDAGEQIGIHWRAVGRALDPIQSYCLAEGLPRLTALVHSQDTGVPGAGFLGEPGNEADLREVYNFDWASIPNPFSEKSQEELEKIADELLSEPIDAPEKWVSVLSRGNLQRVFRIAILKAYEYRCAICEIGFEHVLEAAHIVPWASQRRHLRADPRNGICLCANHHRLFDAGRLTIRADFTIEYVDQETEHNDYAPSDIAATVAVHDQKLCLPSDPHLHPDKNLLILRFEK